MNQQILVPLDGSDESAAVLSYAEAVAGLLEDGLCLMRVTEPVADLGWPVRDEVLAQLEEARRAETLGYLSGLAGQYKQKGVEACVRTGTGDAADLILDAASQEEVEFVAMSTHGRGGVQRLLLGSVADKVVRLGTRPLLVLRADSKQIQSAPVVFRRLMVPLDGSELSEQALPLAVRLAARANATLVLVRAEVHFWQRAGGYSPVSNLGEIDEEMTQYLNGYLEKVAARLRPEVQVETKALRGLPQVMLEEFSTESAIDLVVMATHGRGGLRRLAVGSTADRMVRFGIPMLLVRAVSAPRSGGSTQLKAAARASG